ncbi:hypothetical protein M9458_053499, partial [Cirrhinus mrigala]
PVHPGRDLPRCPSLWRQDTRTLGAAAVEDASQAPGEDFVPSAASGLRDVHPELLRSTCETAGDAMIVGDSIVRHIRATLVKVLEDGESVGAIVLHTGVNDIKLRQTEVLKMPDRDGSQHIARDEDHRVRTASYVSTWPRK